jgi:cobalt-zinc-cadmium efflux system membrane fusion protein
MKTVKRMLVPLCAFVIFSVACSPKSNSGEPPKNKNAGETVSPAGSAEGKQALCKAHGARKDLCFFCDASLRDPKRLWCKEHNRYEDRCFECHPEARDASRLFCAEHSLYEDECFFCHPELNPLKKSAAKNEGETFASAARCKEHRVSEVECGICHPELLNLKNPGEGLKIRFESSQSAGKAGVFTAHPESALVQGGLSFPARTAFNDNASAMVLARFSGTVTSVRVDLGDVVKKGEILAYLSSPEIAQIISEFRSADNEAGIKEKEYLREKTLFEKNVSSRQEADNASSAWLRARNSRDAIHQRLMNAGFSGANISEIAANTAIAADFPVRTPVSGTITQRVVSAGQSVEPQSLLMNIVNLSSLWVHIAVPPAIASRLSTGDTMAIVFENKQSFPARIDWVSPGTDPASGMVQVRAELKNPQRTLRGGLFCRAFFRPTPNAEVLAVPSDAVASIDGKDVVFAKIEPDLYEVRRVSLDGILDGKAFISHGLRLQDEIVVTGAFVVKSEFLKSRLGAGCVDD